MIWWLYRLVNQRSWWIPIVSGKTPQDWRKRPEAEMKLPRDPTEAPMGRGSGQVCGTKFGWLFFFWNAKGASSFWRMCHYKNLECIYVYIYIYINVNWFEEGIEGIHVCIILANKQLERSECCWSMGRLIHHQDEMFYLQLGEQETLIPGSILWISVFVCQAQVKVTSVFKRKFNRGKKKIQVVKSCFF